MLKKRGKVEPWGTGRPDYTTSPPTYINKKEWLAHNGIGVLSLILAALGLLCLFVL